MNSAYRLSSTEAVYLIQKERERRRLERIVQVENDIKLNILALFPFTNYYFNLRFVSNAS